MGKRRFTKIASACISMLACLFLVQSTDSFLKDPAFAQTANESSPAFHNYSMHRHLLHLLHIADSLTRRDYGEVASLAGKKLGLQSSAGKRDPSSGFVEPDQGIWELGWRFRQQASRLSELAKTAAEDPTQVDPGAVDLEFVKLAKACHACHVVLQRP